MLQNKYHIWKQYNPDFNLLKNLLPLTLTCWVPFTKNGTQDINSVSPESTKE